MLAKKFPAVLIMVLLVLSLEACGPGGLGITGKATPTPVPAVVNVEKALFDVERGSIVSTKELQGEITPSKQDDLFFRASGFVTRVAVKPGDLVKKGDVLAEMQIDDLLNQLQQAQIDLEVSQANLAKDKVQHEYDIAKAQAAVFEQQKRVDLAKMDLKNAYGDNKERAQVNLDIAKKELELAQQNLDLMSQEDSSSYNDQAVKRNQLSVDRLQSLIAERQITAPYDAIVLNSTVRPGQQIDAFYSSFVVGDPSELLVRATYDYDLATQLNPKTETAVRLNVSDKEDKGLPSSYLPNFRTSSVTDQSQVKGTVSGAGTDFLYFALPTGISKEDSVVNKQVTVIVVLGKKDNVLLLPPAAIREYRGLNFVIVQEGDRRRRVEINKIGLKTPDKVEIEADLKPGDKVLGP